MKEDVEYIPTKKTRIKIEYFLKILTSIGFSIFNKYPSKLYHVISNTRASTARSTLSSDANN